MGNLGNIAGSAAVKAFERTGWSVRGQVGSHVMMTKHGARVNLSVPQHKELSVGTLRKLIGAAGLTVEDFFAVTISGPLKRMHGFGYAEAAASWEQAQCVSL